MYMYLSRHWSTLGTGSASEGCGVDPRRRRWTRLAMCFTASSSHTYLYVHSVTPCVTRTSANVPNQQRCLLKNCVIEIDWNIETFSNIYSSLKCSHTTAYGIRVCLRMIIRSHTQIYVRGTLGIRRVSSLYAGIHSVRCYTQRLNICLGHVQNFSAYESI